MIKQAQEPITMQHMQAEVHTWITTVGKRYFNELTNLGILMEEVGELSRLMVRKYGEQSSKATETESAIADELADVLWVIIALANQTGVDLTESFAANMAKKTDRDATRHLNNTKL